MSASWILLFSKMNNNKNFSIYIIIHASTSPWKTWFPAFNILLPFTILLLFTLCLLFFCSKTLAVILFLYLKSYSDISLESFCQIINWNLHNIIVGPQQQFKHYHNLLILLTIVTSMKCLWLIGWISSP